MAQDGYTIEQIEGVNRIVGATAPDEVKVQVHFEYIQSQILEQIDAAKYIIWLAMAWLTDLTLLRALNRRQKEGINVQIVVFDDEINQKWGVLQPHIAEHFSIYKIKYAGSAKMHNKFCVIDLKIIIHGSYNWTDRARYKNETMEIGESRELACSFADEFIKLKQMASND